MLTLLEFLRGRKVTRILTEKSRNLDQLRLMPHKAPDIHRRLVKAAKATDARDTVEWEPNRLWRSLKDMSDADRVLSESDVVDALQKVESFIRGFDDDTGNVSNGVRSIKSYPLFSDEELTQLRSVDISEY